MLTSALRMNGAALCSAPRVGFRFARSSLVAVMALFCATGARRYYRSYNHKCDFRGDLRGWYGHVHGSSERFGTLGYPTIRAARGKVCPESSQKTAPTRQICGFRGSPLALQLGVCVANGTRGPNSPFAILASPLVSRFSRSSPHPAEIPCSDDLARRIPHR